MKIFNKKPKPEIKEAIKLLQQSISIIYKYNSDKRCNPNKKDMEQLYHFQQVIQEIDCTSKYLYRKINQQYNTNFLSKVN